MSALTIALLALCVCGALVAAFALLAPRKPAGTASAGSNEEQPPPLEPWAATTGWTAAAGEEFSSLSEAARCDLVFAVADLHDDQSQSMLLHALDDPSETVALAAAHVLAQRNAMEAVRSYANDHPGERAQRILQTLELMS